MPQPSDYKMIKAWGQYMGSYHPYIVDQQNLAAQENAPLDAIFRNNDSHVGAVSTWSTVEQVKSQPLRAWLWNYAASL